MLTRPVYVRSEWTLRWFFPFPLPGNRFAFFPSLSAGYRLSEEAFMQPLKPYLSTLKLRGSWGMIGNQDVGTNRYVSTLSSSTDSWIIDGKKVQSTQKPDYRIFCFDLGESCNI